LVDEFQDTDSIQSEIVELIWGRHNNLFCVGDPKQSIYGFRQADVSIFQDFLEKIQRQDSEHLQFYLTNSNQASISSETERRGVIALPDNFRSSESLIKFYNYVFKKIMIKESDFDVGFESLNFNRPSKKEHNSRIGLNLIICQKEHKIENFLPHQNVEIIKIIKSVVGEEYKTGKNGQVSPIDYKDIAILVRDRSRWQELSAALQEAKIPYEVYRGLGFFQAKEIQDVYYILKAISDRYDDFAFIASLRSVYLGVSDAGLFYLYNCLGANYGEKLDFMESYLKGAHAEEAFRESFLEIIKSQNLEISINPSDKESLLWAARSFNRLHLAAHREEYSLLLNEIIETLNMKAVLRNDNFSDQKIANLDKLIQYTYEYERKSSGRMSDFLDRFLQLIKGDNIEGEAPLYIETGNQVKIMTIHASKGLEFPVVILPYIENGFESKDTLYHHKKNGMLFKIKSGGRSKLNSFIGNYFSKVNKQQINAEEKRLLYVSVTRARDHLFFVGANGFKNQTKKSYLKFLLKSLEVEPEDKTANEIVLKDEIGFQVSRNSIHSDTPVPNYLDWAIQPPKSDQETDVSIAKKVLIKYSAPLNFPLPKGEYSATQLMIYEENPDRFVHHFYLKNGEIWPESLITDYGDEPGGLTWGGMVHRAFENYHLRDISEEKVQVERIVRNHQIPDSEKEKTRINLIDVLDNFRKTDLGKHLLACEQKSEIQASLNTAAGTLTGIFDRLFINKDGLWEVLDFKTNRVEKARVDTLVKKYNPQMRYYALLLANLFPGQGTYPVRLFFLTPMAEYRKEYHWEEIRIIQRQAENTMGKIRDLQEQIFIFQNDNW
jgi:ATP-dependent exoDNAse (exonuclease V) beta subunit